MPRPRLSAVLRAERSCGYGLDPSRLPSVHCGGSRRQGDRHRSDSRHHGCAGTVRIHTRGLRHKHVPGRRGCTRHYSRGRSCRPSGGSGRPAAPTFTGRGPRSGRVGRRSCGRLPTKSAPRDKYRKPPRTSCSPVDGSLKLDTPYDARSEARSPSRAPWATQTHGSRSWLMLPTRVESARTFHPQAECHCIPFFKLLRPEFPYFLASIFHADVSCNVIAHECLQAHDGSMRVDPSAGRMQTRQHTTTTSLETDLTTTSPPQATSPQRKTNELPGSAQGHTTTAPHTGPETQEFSFLSISLFPTFRKS